MDTEYKLFLKKETFDMLLNFFFAHKEDMY